MTDRGSIYIKEAYIKGFGKLKDKRIVFASGFNLIYGANEAGKSTFRLFIKGMFYGLKKRKKAGEAIKERDRAIPFDGEVAEGYLIIEHNMREIKIERRFGKTAKDDEVCAYYTSNGESVRELCCDAPGEKIFGIGEDLFEKTLWTRQSKVSDVGKDTEMSQRLANMMSGGDETVSAENALEALAKEEAKIKAPSGRHLKGELDLAEERLKELYIKKREEEKRTESEEADRERIKALESQLTELSAEVEKADEKIRRRDEAMSAELNSEKLKMLKQQEKKVAEIQQSSEYKRCMGVTNEIAKRAEDLEKEQAAWDKKQGCFKLSAILLCIAGIAAFVAATVAVATEKGLTVYFGAVLTVCLMMLLTASISVKYAKKYLKIKEVKAAELERILTELQVNDVSEIWVLLNKRKAYDEIITSINDTKSRFLDKNSYEYLAKVSSLGYNLKEDSCVDSDKLNEMRKRQLELTAQINRGKAEMQGGGAVIISDIESEIAMVLDSVETYKHKLAVIDKAVDGIKRAAEDRNQNVMPRLSSRVSELLSELTCGKYTKVYVDDEYNVKVLCDGRLMSAEGLSLGTYEQIYLSLRIALAEGILSKRVFGFDDILTPYDDERVENAVALLKRLGEENQVILFSCRESEKTRAASVGAHIINI